MFCFVFFWAAPYLFLFFYSASQLDLDLVYINRDLITETGYNMT